MSETHIPDFLDISPDAQAAATAAMSRKLNLDPPADASSYTTEKGDTYERWNEAGLIEAAWRETTKTGLITAVIQVKIRAGMPNQHERTWGRHLIHPGVLAGVGNEEQIKKYANMNDRSINALTTLINATGFTPETGGISGKLLGFLFPTKNAPGAKSPLCGKTAVVNLVNSPNKGEKAKSPRQTNIDSYLPDGEVTKKNV